MAVWEVCRREKRSDKERKHSELRSKTGTKTGEEEEEVVQFVVFISSAVLTEKYSFFCWKYWDLSGMSKK